MSKKPRDKSQHGQGSNIPLMVKVEQPGEVKKRTETASINTKNVEQPGKGQGNPEISSIIQVKVEQPGEVKKRTETASINKKNVEQPGKGQGNPEISSIIQEMKQGTSENQAEIPSDEIIRIALKWLILAYEHRRKVTWKSRDEFILRADASWSLECLGTAYENVTAKDIHGNTPLHYAVIANCVPFLVSYLSKHPETLNIGNRNGETPLLLAAKLDRFEIFMKLIDYREVDLDIQCTDDEKTPLHYAVMSENKKMVEFLLQKQATEKTEKDGRTPLSYAAEVGHAEIARMLLQCWLVPKADKNLMLPEHYAAKNGHTDVIHVLLKNKYIVHNCTNKDGNNCLDLAIEGNHRETVMALINSSEWDKLLRTQSVFNPSPFRKLVLKMPDAAREVLNRCIHIEGSKMDFKVTFSYEFLEDTPCPDNWKHRDEGDNYRYFDADKLSMKKHPLMIMVTEERTELLQHPLVSALLKKKWHNGFALYIITLFFHIIFLSSLMVFAMNIKAPFQSSNNSTEPSTSSEDNGTHYKIVTGTKWIVIILASLDIIVEIVKRVSLIKERLYFEEMGQLLEWIACAASLCFVASPDSEYRPVWQWSFGIISILLVWINVVSQFQKFEFLGMYIIMLNRIVQEFLKFFLIVCFPLVVMFVFCFYLLFQNQKEFGTWLISFVKTTTMMTGEVTFNEMLFGEDVHNDFISFFTFYVFLLLMTLVVVNVTIGLAVDKIQEFRNEAAVIKKEMQIEFVFTLEKHVKQLTAVLRCLRCNRRANKRNEPEIYFPNKQRCLRKLTAKAWNLTEKDIMTALNTETAAKQTNLEFLTPLKTELRTVIQTEMKSLESNLMFR